MSDQITFRPSVITVSVNGVLLITGNQFLCDVNSTSILYCCSNCVCV